MKKIVFFVLIFLLIELFFSFDQSTNKQKVVSQEKGQKMEETKAEKDVEEIHYGALETYRYWAGENPPDDIKIINGQYWSSAHFTKEYVMYLELKVPVKLASSFPKDNNLILSDKKFDFSNDAPDWFKPPKNYQVWLGQQGSKYFINLKTGHIFIYELQF
ncbi:MAG: hypothetical protein ACK5D5_13175 [Bacteroidota bacterium]|jgi:hypothetical protein